MAMQVRQIILGADVSKDWLDIGVHGEDEPTRIDNQRREIDTYLRPSHRRNLRFKVRFFDVPFSLSREWSNLRALTVRG